MIRVGGQPCFFSSLRINFNTYRSKTENKRLTASRGGTGGNGTTTKPNPKPRIASAKGRVKPLARLLRCATALRVTAPLGYGSRRLV